MAIGVPPCEKKTFRPQIALGVPVAVCSVFG
jgi:hypothetical protein